ncbi:hypothetical protein BH09BAC1_BH09BAC1_09340 [soil metagenome]
MINTYLQYGIPSELANEFAMAKVSVTTFKSTSNKNLIERYGFDEVNVKLAKNYLIREAIDEDIVQLLLQRSNFVCCLCKGVKGKSYIIHHIEEYSKSQDNGYENLAVLCPNDHDDAHKQGLSLTKRITPGQIKKAKKDWEKQVESINVLRAAFSEQVESVEYVNVPRILELVQFTINDDKTKYSGGLLEKGLINKDGTINLNFHKEYGLNLNNPLNFFGGHGSIELRMHYFELLKRIANTTSFKDLDSLLNQSSIKNGIVGEFCVHIGGLYGENVKLPITDSSPIITLYLKRKPFLVEWKIDPRYITSSTASQRLARATHAIYGRIMHVEGIELNGEKVIFIDIRCYAMAFPVLEKDRTPSIHYEKKDYSEYFEDDTN